MIDNSIFAARDNVANTLTNNIEDYGQATSLSYNSYLRVADLIALQDLQSSPAHHDELLFITIHQTYELWFKQILHEIDAAINFIAADKFVAATRTLARVVEIEKVLVAQIHVLETMTPIDFLGFRDALNPASGFQSMQFREIETASGLKDERVLKAFAEDDFAQTRLRQRLHAVSLSDAFYFALTRAGFDVATDNETAAPEVYARRVRAVVKLLTDYEHHAALSNLAEMLIAHDEQIVLWRTHHVVMVERMLGTKPGTGGSSGVGYLQSTLSKKIYPEMWQARTHLSTQINADDSTSGGCPFA